MSIFASYHLLETHEYLRSYHLLETLEYLCVLSSIGDS